MKNLISALFLLALSSTQAQNVSDFKYVYVPTIFKDFKSEDYQLNTYIKSLLRKKNYEIIAESSTQKPSQYIQDKCIATTVDIQKIKSFFHNKVNVVFTDCNDNIIKKIEGVSEIKQFDKGYQDALKLAMDNVAEQGTFTSLKVLNPMKIEPQESNKEANRNILYSQSKKYEIVELSKTKAQLIEFNSKKIIANIYPSSLNNILHIEVITDKGNYNTFGYTEGSNFIIEYLTTDNSWSTTTYTK